VITAVLGLGLVAFRDPHGIRPLVLGKRTAAAGDEYIVASESVALDVLGFERMRDVAPGEAVVITARGELFTQMCAQPQQHAPCIFEFVYFARPDSMMDDISVHKARMRMGVKLGEKILRLRPDHDIDVVIPIPDTSRDAALEIANVLGVKYREGFIKNRYVGRTFIMPGQGERAKSVKRKLNPIPLEFKNRVVLLVDDSIVRGTTSKQIVQMARDAGAKKVYLASAAPPVRYPNIYGIDMPSVDELVAHDRSEAEIEQLLGCDWLIYQDLADLEDAVSGPKHRITHFDSSCFDGKYVTGIEPGYFERIQQLRSDEAKKKRRVAV
jgi:amidophosphoribosyltransferase